jgi:hypothetical protein
MEKYGHTIKKSLLGFILLVLILPLLQQHVRFYDPEPLKGYHIPKEKIWFSKAAWFDGTYQEAYNDWHNENFGFRNECVRIYNQVAFNLYNIAKANDVVIGKENYLYELNYVKAYCGTDFVGEPQLVEWTTQLKALQDSLEKKNVTLVVCLAAGKASFYPEYIPDDYGPGADVTNYKRLSALLKQYDVNHIDYNAWFMQMKGKTEYPLFPKTGIHWSRYGAMFAVDSLVKYVEHKRGIDMPGVVWEKSTLADTITQPDDDIGEAMNLMWPITPLKMGEPKYHWEDTTGKTMPTLMAVSDSYFWTMFEGLRTNTFKDIAFYYYNKEIFRATGGQKILAEPDIAMYETGSNDVVMIMATEANMWGIGWGYIQDAFNHFVAHKAIPERDLLARKYEMRIRIDDVWMEAIRKKAAERNIDVETMIKMDAAYLADEELKNKK